MSDDAAKVRDEWCAEYVKVRAILESILEWHESGEDPRELILRMIDVKHALGVEGYCPERNPLSPADKS